MTRKMPSSTSQAAPVCDPENRESRPSRCGLLRSRITANVMIPTSTSTANRSSMNAMNVQWSMPGNFLSNRLA